MTKGTPTSVVTMPVHSQNVEPVMKLPFNVPAPWKIHTTPVSTSAIPSTPSVVLTVEGLCPAPQSSQREPPAMIEGDGEAGRHREVPNPRAESTRHHGHDQ
jgi:hypothetical protein